MTNRRVSVLTVAFIFLAGALVLVQQRSGPVQNESDQQAL